MNTVEDQARVIEYQWRLKYIHELALQAGWSDYDIILVKLRQAYGITEEPTEG